MALYSTAFTGFGNKTVVVKNTTTASGRPIKTRSQEKAEYQRKMKIAKSLPHLGKVAAGAKEQDSVKVSQSVSKGGRGTA